jgi:hypothetical protein
VHHTGTADGHSAEYELILLVSFVICHDKRAGVGGQNVACQKNEGGVKSRLRWSQNGHNTTDWTDSTQRSRYHPHNSLCQRLQCNRSDWNVVSQPRPTVWRQQIGLVSSRQSGQIPAAVYTGFECCYNGQNVSNITC